jgi:Tol biopolymer transport system component/serine/threonine protein kinase
VILASLRHSNLPRVTDHFTIENQGQYLVMDYIEGRDLRHMMDDGPLPEDEAVQIGIAVCDALAYLHSRRPSILHRDIKPGNIRIGPDGHVYLVDFGLAKMVNEDESTLMGARAMTPGYSPPEQYGTSRTDTRTDIYSLGATLYAALSGFIPEDGLSRAVDEVKLTPLSKRNPKVSKRVAAMIEKAMETQTARRYQSAEEFKRALLNEEPEQPKSDVESSTGDTATEPPLPPAATQEKNEAPRRKSSPTVWLLIIGILATLVSGIGWTVTHPESAPESFRSVLAFISRPTSTSTLTTTPTVLPVANQIVTATRTITATSKPTRTITPTERSSSTAAIQPLATLAASPTSTETLTATPEPTLTGGGTGEIAFASSRDGLPQIYLANTDGSAIRPLVHELNGACQPAWSPDGEKLVYISPCLEKSDQYRRSSFYILDLESGETHALLTSPGGNFEPAWSPDGTKIVFTSVFNGLPQIHILNLDDQSVTRLTDGNSSSQASQADWSPDGKQIVYTARRFNLLQIWTMNIDGKNQVQLLRSGGSFSDYLPAWSPDASFILFSETNVSVSSPSSLMRFVFGAQKAETVLLPSPVVDADFSPDGDWISYETSDTKNQDIYIGNLSGGTPQPLTTDPALDFDPAWRP